MQKRKHHCRGCGYIYCSDCLRNAPLDQYGIDPSEKTSACMICASPYIHFPEPTLLPTAGGDLLLEVYNLYPPFSASWGGVPVPGVDFVKTSSGPRLRIPVPAGTGSKMLSLFSKGVGSKLFEEELFRNISISYSPPSILRVAPIKTEGGELTIFGENFGDDTGDVPEVLIDGVPATGVKVKQNHKKITCIAPPGIGISEISVKVGGQSCKSDALHAAPEIKSLEPPDIDMTGGEITINGNFFGTDSTQVKVVMPDFGIIANDVTIVEPHTKVTCMFPPIPQGASAGEPLRLRIIVGGLHSISPVVIVYCPPGGAPPMGDRPAYLPKRFSTAAKKGPLAVPSPYAELFSTELSAGKKSISAPPTTKSGLSKEDAISGSAPAAVTGNRAPSVRVGGTLSGSGPTLSIASPTNWSPDSPNCDSCKQEFGIARRRHHCRICGCCVCAACSPHQLQLASNKPAVRVCEKCNVRVGLLNQMTAVVDSIYAIKKLLPPQMWGTFQQEVLDAVGHEEIYQSRIAGSTMLLRQESMSSPLGESTPSKLDQ
jgi:hypothetical protein